MIGDKIKERRLELGLTQAQLSNMTGIKSNTISNYENNISSPNETNLFKLFTALNCDANYLFEWKETEKIEVSYEEKKHIKKYRKLDAHGKKMVDFTLDEEYDRCMKLEEEEEEEPTIDMRHSYYKASAGIGFDLDDDDNWEIISIPDTYEARRADFAVTVEGDSMEPMFSDGDMVLVKAQKDIEIGQIGIFRQGERGYIKEKGKDRLISLNPDYDDIYPNEYEEIRCIGKVIGKVEKE